MKLNETILLYNFNDKKIIKKIKVISIQMGIRIKSAVHKDLHETVGFLLGMKGIEQSNNDYKQEAMDKELLVMNGFTNQRLNLFLEQLRKKGVPKINYKAIITPTNQSWTLKQLYIEVEKEHKEMKGDFS